MKVTCFNYKQVLKWYEEHGEPIEADPETEANGADDEDAEESRDELGAGGGGLGGLGGLGGGSGWRDADALSVASSPSKDADSPTSRMSSRQDCGSEGTPTGKASRQQGGGGGGGGPAASQSRGARESVEAHIKAARRYQKIQRALTPAREREGASSGTEAAGGEASPRTTSRGASRGSGRGGAGGRGRGGGVNYERVESGEDDEAMNLEETI